VVRFAQCVRPRIWFSIWPSWESFGADSVRLRVPASSGAAGKDKALRAESCRFCKRAIAFKMFLKKFFTGASAKKGSKSKADEEEPVAPVEKNEPVEKKEKKERTEKKEKKEKHNGKTGAKKGKSPKVSKATFLELFEMGQKIGAGNFSTVHTALEKTGERRHVAVKKMDKRRLRPSDLDAVKSEVSILKGLNHEHIIKLYDMYETRDHFFIVTELAQGGELFERIVKKEYYEEADAVGVVTRIAQALQYCHERGVVHRDLKPENILLAEKDNDDSIKLVDFGFAKEVNPEGASGLQTTCGTPGYVAPEIISGKPYGSEVDVWSLGVITYILLCGYPPFYDSNQQNLFRLIRAGAFKFDAEFWDQVSDEAKDLIKKCLVVNPKKRITIDQVLEHPWIVSGGGRNRDITPALAHLRRYQMRRKLKQSMNVVGFVEFTKGAADNTRRLVHEFALEEVQEETAATMLQAIWRGQIAKKKISEIRAQHKHEVMLMRKSLERREKERLAAVRRASASRAAKKVDKAIQEE